MNEIKAEIKKVEKVLGQKLSIPYYQRPYRWKEENVRLLLQDIFDSWKGGKKSYRIGSVILHKEKEKLDIVDGQQRITTILLIFKVLSSDIGKSLRSEIQYKHEDSKNNIKRNHDFIKNWIKGNVRNEEHGFCTYLSDYCDAVEIVVADISEAFQMFDSQNGRGKELEPYNLLKAYHIRAMGDECRETKKECDRRWERATRHKKGPDETVTDVLKQIFDEQLYRTRIWSKKEIAYDFNKRKISEFKGTAIDRHCIKYPFQNNQLLQYIAGKYFESVGLGVKGVRSRFCKGDPENINPFVSINQNITDGKPFFDYIETYCEIYRRLFSSRDSDLLKDFKEFYGTYCCDYPGAHRVGDKYLRELYKSFVFLVFDKYGEDGLKNYYKTLYLLVYRIRLEKLRVGYNTVANYPKDEKLFSIIEESKDYLDLQELEKKARMGVNCRKEVDEIKKVFVEEGIKITEDS